MICIAIAIITYILLVVLLRDPDDKDKFDSTFVTALLLISLACGLAVDAGVYAFFYKNQSAEVAYSVEVVSSVELVSLQDESSSDGKFFLGSGSVKNNEYYAFYYKTEHGDRYDTLQANNDYRPVYINYISADEHPRINEYSGITRTYFKEPNLPIWLSLVALIERGGYEPGDLISEERSNRTYDDCRYEILIPRGSIKQDYTIDLT